MMAQHNRLILSMLSALLDYPDQALLDSLGEIRATLGEAGALPPGVRANLGTLIDQLSVRTLIESQEYYVDTFDRSRTASLYLFEHVHGESRERGQAMVDLLTTYEAHGLALSNGELPDYLPVFLEFLAQLEHDEARGLLGEISHIVSNLANSLSDLDTPYTAAVDAVLALAGEVRQPGSAAQTASEPGEPDHEALDREWEDPPVSFLGAPGALGTTPQPVHFYEKRPAR